MYMETKYSLIIIALQHMILSLHFALFDSNECLIYRKLSYELPLKLRFLDMDTREQSGPTFNWFCLNLPKEDE